MPESREHIKLKDCAARLFGGKTEATINGRVDVKAPEVCVEVETSGKTNRLEHSINKLSSPACRWGVLVVPSDALGKKMKLRKDKNIMLLPISELKRLCSTY